MAAFDCAALGASTHAQSGDGTIALASLEGKICVTEGNRLYTTADRCAQVVDRATYVQPLLDVFRAAPPIMRAYLCSVDRIYFDSNVIWNADSRVTTDSLTGEEYRSIGVRKGLLERKVSYVDWATGWTQHWWTGSALDHPQDDRMLPRVDSDLTSSGGVLFQLVAHELAHLLAHDYGVFMRQRPSSRFEAGEFGFVSWISTTYMDSAGNTRRAVARDTAVESVRTIDFDGNAAARIAMRAAAAREGRAWEAGSVNIANWKPASPDRISQFLEQLDRSAFTTVFSTWWPPDDWTESFVMMMLPSVASRYDIVTADGRRLRVLQKVLDEQSPFGPKRRFIQGVIEQALSDFRNRQAATHDACLAVALK